MKRSPLVSKGALMRMFQSAEEARLALDFPRAAEFLERASRLDPANATLLLNLGHAQGKNFDYAGAERSFNRAINLASNKTRALTDAAMRAQDFGSATLAGQYYRLASDRVDATPDVFVALAENSERLSRLEESAHWVDRALALTPHFAPALLVRARLNKQTGQIQRAEEILRKLLVCDDPAVRVKAGYDLGAILDRQQRYDEAMAMFQQTKALLMQEAGPHLESAKRVRAQLKELLDALTPEIFHRWHETQPDLAPLHRLSLLCGHPRSGTTLLEQVLDSHPDVMSAEETSVFHDHAYPLLSRNASSGANVLAVLEGASLETLRAARRNYFRCMESFLGTSPRTHLLIDKNPILTFLIAPFIRIFPETKLLVALRDPRDVCLSCFMQPLTLNQSAAAFLTLEGTVEDYAALMTTYLKLAPQIHNERMEIRYEEMVEDLESTSRRTLEFLGLPWNERVLQFHEHAQKKLVRSPTYADVTKPVFKRAVGRWRNYQKFLEPHLAQLETFVKALGYPV